MSNYDDLSTISDEEWPDFVSAVYQENSVRETKRTARDRMAEIAAEYEAVVSREKPKDFSSLEEDAQIGPGEHVIVNGVEYENISGAWLPATAGPIEYPIGWKKAGEDVPIPSAVPAWEVGVKYSIGDTVSFEGKVYKCINEHVSQDDWKPGVAFSLWAED